MQHQRSQSHYILVTKPDPVPPAGNDMNQGRGIYDSRSLAESNAQWNRLHNQFIGGTDAQRERYKRVRFNLDQNTQIPTTNPPGDTPVVSQIPRVEVRYNGNLGGSHAKIKREGGLVYNESVRGWIVPRGPASAVDW